MRSGLVLEIVVIVPGILGQERCRESWERQWTMDFPGKKWGRETRCPSPKKNAPEKREAWIEMATGKGLEIGACDMPLNLPLEMDYVDIRKESHVLCFGAKNTQVNIIDDATTLSTIPNDTYDLVAAAHVLEHQENVIQTLLAWLRVSKKYIYFIVPDICEPKSGDIFRLLTKPSHFFHEYMQNNSRHYYKQHLHEAAIGAAYFNISGTALPFPQDGCLSASPQLLSQIVDDNLAPFPYAAHLHTFSLSSLQTILFRLHRLHPFDLVRIATVEGDGKFLHDEVRVLLRKKKKSI